MTIIYNVMTATFSFDIVDYNISPTFNPDSIAQIIIKGYVIEVAIQRIRRNRRFEVSYTYKIMITNSPILIPTCMTDVSWYFRLTVSVSLENNIMYFKTIYTSARFAPNHGYLFAERAYWCIRHQS